MPQKSNRDSNFKDDFQSNLSCCPCGVKTMAPSVREITHAASAAVRYQTQTATHHTARAVQLRPRWSTRGTCDMQRVMSDTARFDDTRVLQRSALRPPARSVPHKCGPWPVFTQTPMQDGHDYKGLFTMSPAPEPHRELILILGLFFLLVNGRLKKTSRHL